MADELPVRVERRYHSDGTLRLEVHLRGEKIHGFRREWHRNGQLASESFLEDGEHVNSVMRDWNDRGELRREILWINGHQMGRMTIWNDDGSIMVRNYWLEQGIVSRAEYDAACATRPELPRYTAPDGPVAGPPSEPPWLNKAMALLKAMQAIGPTAPARDPELAAREHQRFVGKMLSSRHAEALEWLRGASRGSTRNLGEMDERASTEFVERLYKLGAAEVLAVEIEDCKRIGDDQTSNHLLVRLPLDLAARARLFEFEGHHAESEGFDGDVDRGQQYLYFKLC